MFSSQRHLSHHRYEVSCGLGPAILALSLQYPVYRPHLSHACTATVCSTILFISCLLERAPWAYLSALILGIAWRLGTLLRYKWNRYNQTTLPVCPLVTHELLPAYRSVVGEDQSLPGSPKVHWSPRVSRSDLPSYNLPNASAPSNEVSLFVGLFLRYTLVIAICAFLISFSTPPVSIDVPYTSLHIHDSHVDRPLLNIIVLSAPRPDPISGLAFLTETLDSYLPLLRTISVRHQESGNFDTTLDHGLIRSHRIQITAYTRSDPQVHVAFTDAEGIFRHRNKPSVRSMPPFGDYTHESSPISFLETSQGSSMDLKDAEREQLRESVRFIYDPRPLRTALGGLHVDAAGLLDFAYSGMPDSNATRLMDEWRVAEWTMIVEDDFPLCVTSGRGNGARAVLGVVSELERRRLRSVDALKGDDGPRIDAWPRSAWVGTGGSGLIFHRSILKSAAHLLRAPSLLDSSFSLPPADLILQSCVLGSAPATSRVDAFLDMFDLGVGATGTIGAVGCGNRGAIISSRLAMRHAGGANSALDHSTPTERWQCGWRYVALSFAF